MGTITFLAVTVHSLLCINHAIPLEYRILSIVFHLNDINIGKRYNYKHPFSQDLGYAAYDFRIDIEKIFKIIEAFKKRVSLHARISRNTSLAIYSMKFKSCLRIRNELETMLILN